MAKKLTHFDNKGQAKMVDISAKPKSARLAKAQALLRMKAETLNLIKTGSAPKGDVLAVARIAGIMAAKQTAHLIPLCHPLALETISIDFEMKSDHLIITASAKIEAKTGVEMEALIAVSIASLTLYDMVKAIEPDMVIEQMRLIEKSGGQKNL